MHHLIMHEPFWKAFWGSVRKSYGGLVGIFSAPFAFVLWYFPTDTRVPLGIVIVGSTLGIAMLVSLSHMSYTAVQRLSHRVPRVAYSRKGSGAFEDCVVVCLLEEAPLFGHGMAVSFYFKDSVGFEVLIGVGMVINVQDDRRIQVGLQKVAKGQEDAVGKLRSNDSDALQRLLVKPNVPAYRMDIGENGEFDD